MSTTPSPTLLASRDRLHCDLTRWKQQLVAENPGRTHVIGMVTKGLSRFEVLLRDMLVWYVAAFDIDSKQELRKILNGKEIQQLTLGEVVTAFDKLNKRLTRSWRHRFDDPRLQKRMLVSGSELETFRYLSTQRKALHRDDMEETLVANAKEILASIEASLDTTLVALPSGLPQG